MRMIFQIIIMIVLASCQPKLAQVADKNLAQNSSSVSVITGAQRTADYLPKLKNNKVALVVNQTSLINNTHLVDSLLKLGISIKTVFSPEHGFRGNADAGEVVKDAKDKTTGLPIISLYGKKKKPLSEDLAGIDIIIFDIQDVGVRFYTYISTLHYVMEACAENKIPLIVLDRPNPNGHYIDGEILQPNYRSFVGMHPVPTVYGMTIGEYAQMINGEGWLANQVKCDLTVISCKEYTHQTYYELPVKPSPNLPDMKSILLYPSLCFFEGTTLSIGRGTNKPFQVIGHPKLKSNFQFTPMPNEGAKDPLHKGLECQGEDLSLLDTKTLKNEGKIDLSYIIKYHQKMKAINEKYFLDNNFIDKLSGSDALRHLIENGKSEADIRASWKDGIESFKKIREKYLIYK